MTPTMHEPVVRDAVQAIGDRPVAEAAVRVSRASAEDAAARETYTRLHPDGTFFHLPAWAAAVHAAFGHRDETLVARRGTNIVGVLPMMRVDSRLLGRTLVSMPCAVGGGLLADDDQAQAALFTAACELTQRDGCTAIDLRSSRAVLRDVETVDDYAGFRRELPSYIEELDAWLPRKARAAARNARTRHGLTAAFGDEHLDDVYALYTQSMRRLGSLNYPKSFFDELLARSPGGHWVSVVQREGRTVAGLVTFLFEDTVLPYFVGAGEEARACSAGQFVYFTVMQRAVAEGYRWFDFGRSRRDNAGSYEFKRLCGFTPEPLGYQRYIRPGAAQRSLTPSSGLVAPVRWLWRRLPLAVTRPAGCWLSRHLPG
jgi:FemAB-related protein (PEP-CTERM system-associated)